MSILATSYKQYGITKREAEILSLLTQGKTSRKIGDQLCISPQTVRSHIKRIYRKLDVHNKIEAIIKTNSLMKD